MRKNKTWKNTIICSTPVLSASSSWMQNIAKDTEKLFHEGMKQRINDVLHKIQIKIGQDIIALVTEAQAETMK